MFLDKTCERQLPAPLPDMADAQIHLVVVARGVSSTFASITGGSGSLMIEPSVIGRAQESRPFTVGDIDSDRPFVHILDDTSFNILLRQLDTISDFTRYLGEKEALIRSGRLSLAAGEEELLALYLETMNERAEHSFPGEDATNLIVDEGLWTKFSNSETHKESLKQNQVSYAWDHLIQDTIGKHVLEQSLEFSTGQLETDLIPIRTMAAETRFARRILARTLRDACEAIGDQSSFARVVPSPSDAMLTYVYLILSSAGFDSYPEYRQARGARLHQYCRAAAARIGRSRTILGLAMDPPGGGGSEDVLYLDVSDRTAADYQAAADEADRLGLLQKDRAIESRIRDDEFPMPASAQYPKKGRSAHHRLHRKQSPKDAELSKRKAKRKAQRKSRRVNRRRR